MFENGSGEVLAEARIVSLVAWLVAASVPPISAAAVTQLAWSPPNTAAGERRAGGDADEGVDRVPDAVEARDLVDEELDEEHHAAAPRTIGLGEHVQVAGQRDPAEPARQAGEEDDGVEAQAAGPAEGGGDGDELGQVEVHGVLSVSATPGSRLSRKLCTPSLPSALARMSAMRRAVSARSSALISRPATSCTSCLQARVAIGPLATIARDDARSTLASIAVGRADLVREAHRPRLGGAEALGGDEVAPRRLLAHGADDVRADRRRQQAEPRFAEAEGDAVGGDADVAHRREAEAAGVAVAVDAGDDRHRAAVHRPQHLGERRGVGAVLLPGVAADLAHEGQVGAGAERLAAAAEDDRAHARASSPSAAKAAASSRSATPLRALRTSGRSSQTRAHARSMRSRRSCRLRRLLASAP